MPPGLCVSHKDTPRWTSPPASTTTSSSLSTWISSLSQRKLSRQPLTGSETLREAHEKAVRKCTTEPEAFRISGPEGGTENDVGTGACDELGDPTELQPRCRVSAKSAGTLRCSAVSALCRKINGQAQGCDAAAASDGRTANQKARPPPFEPLRDEKGGRESGRERRGRAHDGRARRSRADLEIAWEGCNGALQESRGRASESRVRVALGPALRGSRMRNRHGLSRDDAGS